MPRLQDLEERLVLDHHVGPALDLAGAQILALLGGRDAVHDLLARLPVGDEALAQRQLEDLGDDQDGGAAAPDRGLALAVDPLRRRQRLVERVARGDQRDPPARIEHQHPVAGEAQGRGQPALRVEEPADAGRLLARRLVAPGAGHDVEKPRVQGLERQAPPGERRHAPGRRLAPGDPEDPCAPGQVLVLKVDEHAVRGRQRQLDHRVALDERRASRSWGPFFQFLGRLGAMVPQTAPPVQVGRADHLRADRRRPLRGWPPASPALSHRRLGPPDRRAPPAGRRRCHSLA